MEHVNEERGWFSRMTLGVFDAEETVMITADTVEKQYDNGGIEGAREIGSTGLKQTGGYLFEEWHRNLRGRRGVRIYREMRDNDATISAVLYAIESLILQAPWHIETPTDKPTESQIAARDFVKGALFDDMSHTWQSFLSELLSMITYGWSYFEVVYKVRDGKKSRFNDGEVGWKKFAVRGQETLEKWEFDKNGGVRAMIQNDYYTGARARIPLAKSLLFTFRSHLNSPEGRSGLRGAYRSWYFLKKLQEIEAIGIERDLAGLPVMQAPARIMSKAASTVDKAIRATLFKIVKAIRVDEQMGILIPGEMDENGKPTGYKLSLLSTGGKRASDAGGAIDRYSKEIAMTLLAQFLFLGMDRAGSFALADNSTAMFAVAIGATMDRIVAVFNRHAIPPLMRLNAVPQEDWPILVHGDVEVRDVEKLARAIQMLVASEAISPEGLEERLRQIMNLPPREAKPDDTDTPPQQANGNSPTDEAVEA